MHGQGPFRQALRQLRERLEGDACIAGTVRVTSVRRMAALEVARAPGAGSVRLVPSVRRRGGPNAGPARRTQRDERTHDRTTLSKRRGHH